MSSWPLLVGVALYVGLVGALILVKRLFLDPPLPSPQPSVPAAPEPLEGEEQQQSPDISNPTRRLRSPSVVTARRANAWLRLSDYIESLTEPKSVCDKLVARAYNMVTDDSGDVAVMRLRSWMQFFADAAILELILIPVIIILVLVTWPVWMPLVTAMTGVSLDATVITGADGVVMGAGNTALYEWHTVSGLTRAVPYCTEYDKAAAIYDTEIRLLLAQDRLNDEKPHARCVMRLPPHDTQGHVWTIGHAKQALLNMIHKPSLAKVLLDRAPDAAPLPSTSSTNMRPHLYVLRDGERYLRLTVRKDDASGLETRMVRERDLIQLLVQWQEAIADSVLGAELHYCMCPTFLGILNNMTFSFNAGTNQWEIWFEPHVTRVNPLSTLDTRRMKYSPAIAAFPFHQNQDILARLSDPAGLDHMVTHYDTVHVQYTDSTRLRFPDDLDRRERFWMGHGAVARIHEPALPFALTVPLAGQTSERLLTGRDSVCYYHCQHILELLQPLAM